MDVESLSAGILTGKTKTPHKQGMNFVPDIIAWQIPLSFVIALFGPAHYKNRDLPDPTTRFVRYR
jgi:hypothetical protein